MTTTEDTINTVAEFTGCSLRAGGVPSAFVDVKLLHPGAP